MTIDTFKTPLGTVELNIQFKGDSRFDKFESPQSILLKNFRIEIIAFNDIVKWNADSPFPVEDSKGWIVRVKKTTEDAEQIVVKCELQTEDLDIISIPDSGEHLDAIWIENKTYFLSIGTEDGEVLKSRAEVNDYMPPRFGNQLGIWPPRFSFTKYLDLGFKTTLPALLKDENIYLHYLVAINPRKKSKEHPDENDISTTLAVDIPKRTLIERLKIHE